MMEKALRPYRKMKLCLIEKDLPTPSYTITTVKTLKKQYPDDDFVWIIGDDQYANLDQWKAVDELRRLVQFAVFSCNSQLSTFQLSTEKYEIFFNRGRSFR